MIDYEDNPWWFRGVPFQSKDIGKFVGFVYLIECVLDGRLYIGRKYFHTMRKVKGKSRRVKMESDWKNYWSSSEVVHQMIEKYGLHNFRRSILSLHTTKGDVNYTEVKEQFARNVLENPVYMNDNINGKYFKKPSHIIEGRMLNE